MAVLAEQLVKSFLSLGVKHVFGIPGGPSIPYLEAMRSNGLQFVLVSNEQSAAIMADVCGRLTGIPGVCHATFGPGATNLATGVGEALLDRSPLIALTTEVKPEDIGRKVQMNIDHQALFKPLTKWTTRLSGDNFSRTIKKACEVALAEMPGPVHIGLPVNIAAADVDPSPLDDLKRTLPPSAEPNILADALRLLQKAKRPVLAVGNTALRWGLSSILREFLNKNNIPVFLTPMAKGLVPTDHPCYGGVLFHAKSDIAAKIYRKADLVIGLGYDPVEFNYEAWMPQVPLLHIDSEQADITPEYEVICEVLGNPYEALAYFKNCKLPSYEWDLAELAKKRDMMFQELQPGGDEFTAARMTAVLRGVMPEDGILTADVGAHLHLLGQLWRVNEPYRFIITNGWSAMGFGIPAAIGAKLCRPQNSVACVTGDGGFLMNCGELLTARRLGINVVVVVMCDKSLSLIEVKQDWQKLPNYCTDLYEGEYFAAGKFLGVPVLTVHDEHEAKEALIKGFSARGPVIIEAVVERAVYKNILARSYK